MSKCKRTLMMEDAVSEYFIEQYQIALKREQRGTIPELCISSLPKTYGRRRPPQMNTDGKMLLDSEIHDKFTTQ